jgi:antitoxin HicB
VKSKINPHIGGNFDDFLREEGIYEEVEAAALKKAIASALARQMKRRRVTVSGLAAALGTSRAAVKRVLDDRNTSITLTTISRAASALGCRVKLEIVAV